MEGGEGEIPHRTVNKHARPEKAGAAHAQQPGAGNLVTVAVGGKLHRRLGKPTSHMNCK
jgi:hypothetical protein